MQGSTLGILTVNRMATTTGIKTDTILIQIPYLLLAIILNLKVYQYPL